MIKKQTVTDMIARLEDDRNLEVTFLRENYESNEIDYDTWINETLSVINQYDNQISILQQLLSE